MELGNPLSDQAPKSVSPSRGEGLLVQEDGPGEPFWALVGKVLYGTRYGPR